MNKKLLLLILSDVLILSSFGLIGPIFAIFITERLEGGSIVSAGLATTIFLVVKSAVQLPLSRFFIDKEKHKTHSLLLGTLLIITVPFIYLIARHVNTIFLAQAVYGLGAALAYPAWFSLFTTYIDQKHKGFEYTLWGTGVGVGGALAAYLGANVANLFGFQYLFLSVGFIAFLGFLLLIILDRLEMKKGKWKIRTFISVEIPDSIKKEIIKIQNSLPEFIGKKTEQENLHLTLKFLGEIDEKGVELVKEKLRNIKIKKFETVIDEIGVFSEHFIRIIWIHMSNCNELQKEVDDALEGLFEKERRFMSHLTIARIKKIKDNKSFLEKLKKIKIPKIKFMVQNFKLKKSVLKPKGPEYEDLEVYNLT